MLTLKQLMNTIGIGDQFAGTDLKDAYFHVGIHPDAAGNFQGPSVAREVVVCQDNQSAGNWQFPLHKDLFSQVGGEVIHPYQKMWWLHTYLLRGKI